MASERSTGIEQLSVLYVEDDAVTRAIITARLTAKFENVYTCAAGEDGLKIFASQHIDLILTDYLLPRMTGLDMVEQIREINWKLPVILVTGYTDDHLMKKAINLGITQFVPKPVDMKMLDSAIDIAIQRVIAENLKRKNQEQELELLKYRERYHSSQQEIAFLKELHAIRNDCEMRAIDVKKDDNTAQRWFVDLAYHGLDIMSGDSYSVRLLDGNRMFAIVLDAMGKGLGASVTSMMSTTFINHQIENLPPDKSLDLKDLTQEFLNYIQKILLKDEILCATLALIDFNSETMQYCMFSMPKIWMQHADRQVTYVASNNLPIIRYHKEFFINEVSIAGIRKIVLSSDGFSEAADDNDAYYQYIAEDIKSSSLLSVLKKKFTARYPAPEDDLTVLFIRRGTQRPVWEKNFVVSSSLDELQEAERLFDLSLNDVADINKSDRTKLNIAYNEALMNAFEHGNLELTLMEKHWSINDGTYDELIRERQKKFRDRKITTHVALVSDVPNFLRISVTDEGAGLPPKIEPVTERDPLLLCGRGMEIIKQYVDQVYYSRKGNEIIMAKAL